MRAIIARERKRAVEERKAAQAKPPAPTKAKVGWSTKPAPRRKPSPIEKDLAAVTASAKLHWARRHPEAASAERALRKGRVEMLKRWDHKANGTAETHENHAQAREGSLAKLWLTGSIDTEQLESAADIARVAERIGADVAVSTASLETRIDQTRHGDGTFFERLIQVRREVAYTRWRAEVRGPIAAVLDMIVGETVGFTVVAKRYRMHNRRAKKLLIDALDLWPKILGEACKEIDAATLAAAHAGLLA